MDYKNLCVNPNYSIKQVIDVIEKYRERGVVVIEYNKVCGILTLGNIITALANGRDIYSKIKDIYNPNFIYLNSTDYKKAFDIFKTKNLSFIPVINDDYVLLNIITPRDIMKNAVFNVK